MRPIRFVCRNVALEGSRVPQVRTLNLGLSFSRGNSLDFLSMTPIRFLSHNIMWDVRYMTVVF
jgi:hypothetical protein